VATRVWPNVLADQRLYLSDPVGYGVRARVNPPNPSCAKGFSRAAV